MRVVEEILLSDPNIDVNWANPDWESWTALHAAAAQGHQDVTQLLLAHPAIDVNKRDSLGKTPLCDACHFGEAGTVKLLLQDARVLVNVVDNSGCPPIWRAAFWGHAEVVRWLVASGREVDLAITARGHDDYDEREGGCPAVVIARKNGKGEVAALLNDFEANPQQTRHQVRVQLGLADSLATELFAAVVLVCDEYYALTAGQDSRRRFLKMAARLPMELQMVLCHRVYGSLKGNILAKDVEVAFKVIVKAKQRSTGGAEHVE